MKYVIYRDHSGLIITLASDYEDLLVIRRALGASTWGQFLDALPGPERVRVLDLWRDIFGNDIVPGNGLGPVEGADPDVIHRDTVFQTSSVPGFDDGNYPRWPAEEGSISDPVCREVFRSFGKRSVGFIHTFWNVREESISQVREWLEVRGHTLEEHGQIDE